MLGELSDFQRGLLHWYAGNARDLPWRTMPDDSAKPNPYHVLVSETMLQQTQVATVIPYFLRFVRRLPTIAELAAADSQDLLRLWQGLGYYSRARNLQATAKTIINRYSGRLPSSIDELLSLPGIGPYTAGAIASIAFGQRAAILDGNVIRVLCRLDAIDADTRSPAVRKSLWKRAEEILPLRRVGEFNSALMDLGATVCIPRTPRCDVCPVRRCCAAFAAGIQNRLPWKAKAKDRALERRWTFCIRCRGRYLLEQRPARGRWASMWQFATLPAGSALPTPAALLREFGLATGAIRPIGTVEHELTHRRYEFTVYHCAARSGANARPRRWVGLEELDAYPLPRPHLHIAQMLRNAQ